MTRVDRQDVQLFAGLSVALGAIGYFGGCAAQVLSGSVSPVGHAISYGLTPLAAFGINKLASQGRRVSGIAEMVFIVGGYVSSVAAANLLGHSVTIAGPFWGTAALVASVVSVGIFIVPFAVVGGGALYLLTR